MLTDGMYNASYRAAWLSALFLPAVQIVSSLALGYIVWSGGTQSVAGLITIGGIQAFVTYLTFMMWPIQELARVYAEMQHAISSAERIFKMLDTPSDIVDRPQRWLLRPCKAKLSLTTSIFTMAMSTKNRC